MQMKTFIKINIFLEGKRPSAPVFLLCQTGKPDHGSVYIRTVTIMEDVPEEAKLCCCELAEVIYRQEKTEKNASGKTSEKIGTYSASYGSSQELTEAAIRKQNQIVKKWLENTGLCYQGVC